MYINWVHALDLGVAALFMMLLLQQQNVKWPAMALGLLSAFWLGSNMTLVYAGHLGKFGVITFASAALFCIARTAGGFASWPWSILAGGAVGYMCLEQQDVALFFGLCVAAFACFMLYRMQPASWPKRIGLLFLMGGMALWLAGPALLQSYGISIKGVAQVNSENPQAKWEYVTQWSLPPEETIALVAPGYVGWRSGEPEGPYWGRMGRSAGWEQTGQGFMNFKLDDIYLGAIPVIFALIAVFAAARKLNIGRAVETTDGTDNTESVLELPACRHRAEILFWAMVAVLALLLSFGKFFPLYALFYQLPVVNNIRNPTKFMPVFQVAVAILAAYGLDLVLATGADRKKLSVRPGSR